MALNANRERIFGYDLLKAMAMFMVVFYHIDIDLDKCMIDGQFQYTIDKFFYGILSAGVPLFFMVNGALMHGRELNLKWCLTKTMRLLFVAFFWTLVLRCGLMHWLFNRPQLTSFTEFRIFYWFLFTLSILYPINWLLQRFPIMRNLVCLFLFICPFLTNFYWDIRLLGYEVVQMPRWGHTGVFTLYSLVYYYVGQFMVEYTRRHKISIKYYAFSVLIGMLLVYLEVIAFSNYYHELYDGVNASFPTLGALFITIGLFGLIKDIQMKDGWMKALLQDIGRNTIGIYVFHFFFLAFVTEIIAQGSYSVSFVWLESIAIVLVCTYLSKSILNSPFRGLLRL